MTDETNEALGGRVCDGRGRALFVAVVGLLLVAAGCARIPPYQRGRLAHPTMLLVDPASPGEAHIYAIQEGAVGGGAGVEGGCGCN